MLIFFLDRPTGSLPEEDRRQITDPYARSRFFKMLEILERMGLLVRLTLSSDDPNAIPPRSSRSKASPVIGFQVCPPSASGNTDPEYVSDIGIKCSVHHRVSLMACYVCQKVVFLAVVRLGQGKCLECVTTFTPPTVLLFPIIPENSLL